VAVERGAGLPDRFRRCGVVVASQNAVSGQLPVNMLHKSLTLKEIAVALLLGKRG